MSQHYSNPGRKSDPHSLPDLEVFWASILRCPVCEAEYPETDRGGTQYRDTDRETTCCHGEPLEDGGQGFFYWFCLPGCLPESDPMGPFETEAEALEDARDGMEE